MGHRLRIVLLCIAPIVLPTVLVVGWAGWTVSREHDELTGIAAPAGQERALLDANSRLSQEVGYAIVVGKVPDDALPAGLLPWARSGRTMISASAQMKGYMAQADRVGAALLPELESAGYAVSAPVRRVLARWTPAERAAIEEGRATRALPWDDYASALTTLSTDVADAQAASRAAIDELTRRARQPAPWREPAFLGLACGLLALAVAFALAISRAVRRLVGRADAARDAERARADDLERRNERLRHTVGASRRLASGTDLASVSHAVAEETRELIGSAAAAVYLLDEAGVTATPVATAGDAGPAVLAAGAGIVGRAMESAMAARALTVGDPAFPDVEGTVALMAAPLVAGRRVTGAVVVATAGGELANDEDQALLQLIALPAATAIEAARAHDTTALMAHTDALTGVANRRRLDGDLAALGPAPGGAAFLMIDVDHFKAYNDAHGHPAGDALLRDLAALVRTNVREGDVVYRFGGEEFAVLLPGAGVGEAADVGTRVRAAVAAHHFPGGGTQPEGRVTVSVGVSRHAEGRDPAGLVSDADGALYAAKRAGRDRLVVAAPR